MDIKDQEGEHHEQSGTLHNEKLSESQPHLKTADHSSLPLNMSSPMATSDNFSKTIGVINSGVPLHQAMQMAKQEKEEKKLQMLKMEARIKKLQIEEEKANKRIKDAKRQQDFINSMKQEKQKMLEEKQKFFQDMQMREELNRQKIEQDRLRQREQISKKINERVENNKKTTQDIKEQKNRIRLSIEKGKMQQLEERQKTFFDKREHVNRTQVFKQTMQGNFLNQTQNQYQSKIEKAKTEATEYEMKIKELEKYESSLLGKLQQTQQSEYNEMQKLNALKSSSSPSKAIYTSQQSPTHSKQILEMHQYKPLVMCGPSGAGKSTLTNYLMDRYKSLFAFSVSCTTRQPRKGEVDGTHYHFISKEEFTEEVEKGNFLEHNEVHGNYYGTHKKQVLEIMDQQQICILDIDVKGAKDIIKNGSIQCNYVFVQTPTIDDLKQRLIARGTETEESLEKRIENAELELKMAVESGIFKKHFVNESKEKFIEEAVTYVMKYLYPNTQ